VEAQAAGKPVIAFAGGGALETVAEGFSGSFFEEPTVEGFVAALERCDRISTAPADIAVAAERFAPAAFRARLTAEIGLGLQARSCQTPPGDA
jgi:glycosyltransferase involved in cell wall biosynthesis